MSEELLGDALEIAIFVLIPILLLLVLSRRRKVKPRWFAYIAYPLILFGCVCIATLLHLLGYLLDHPQFFWRLPHPFNHYMNMLLYYRAYWLYLGSIVAWIFLSSRLLKFLSISLDHSSTPSEGTVRSMRIPVQVALLVAAASQALVFALSLLPDYLLSPKLIWLSEYSLGAITVVAFLLGQVLWVPIFQALLRFKKLSWAAVIFCGTTLGAAIAAISWPWPMGVANLNYLFHGYYKDFYRDGTATEIAWQNYYENLILFAAMGAVSSAVFYFVWQLFKKTEIASTSVFQNAEAL